MEHKQPSVSERNILRDDVHEMGGAHLYNEESGEILPACSDAQNESEAQSTSQITGADIDGEINNHADMQPLEEREGDIAEELSASEELVMGEQEPTSDLATEEEKEHEDEDLSQVSSSQEGEGAAPQLLSDTQVPALGSEKKLPEARPPSPAPVAHKPQPKKKRPALKWVSIALGLVLLAGALASGYYAYKTYSAEYNRDMAMAKEGVQALQDGGTLLTSLTHNPLGIQNIAQARADFVTAQARFRFLNQDLQALPSQATALPVYGAKLQGAIALLPIAYEASGAGIIVCDTLNLVISRLYNPAGGAAPGLLVKDMDQISGAFQQLKELFAQVTTQIQHLPAGAQELDPRIPKLLKSFHDYLPRATTLINDIDTLLPILPALLGVGTPANYLLEVLDSTELRPGGGFIGNIGILTLSDGRETSATINDVSLLDHPFVAAGHKIAYPAAYRWFDLAPGSWSLRDTNLDADFPTAARYSEQNYQREGGKGTFQGVLAITPALIQHVLTITGPIRVPEYNETVTSDNLISRIHYHQLGASEGSGDIASGDGQSSKRKHFTALLEQHLLERLRQGSSTLLPQLVQLMLNSLQTKDLQVYLNSPVAQGYIQRYGVDSSIKAPGTGDSLFVVDANIAPSKANQFIIDSLDDRVTLDSQGNAIHRTTLQYAWTVKGPIYGSDLYRDYIRIYTPPGSILNKVSGWSSRGKSSAFGRNVWAGFFTLIFGKTATIQFEWSVPHAALSHNGIWSYQYLLQRQAGTQWHTNVQVTLPACTTKILPGGSDAKGLTVTLPFPSLSGDKDNAVQYVC